MGRRHKVENNGKEKWDAKNDFGNLPAAFVRGICAHLAPDRSLRALPANLSPHLQGIRRVRIRFQPVSPLQKPLSARCVLCFGARFTPMIFSCARVARLRRRGRQRFFRKPQTRRRDRAARLIMSPPIPSS